MGDDERCGQSRSHTTNRSVKKWGIWCILVRHLRLHN
jgi:hypothetical protein